MLSAVSAKSYELLDIQYTHWKEPDNCENDVNKPRFAIIYIVFLTIHIENNQFSTQMM